MEQLLCIKIANVWTEPYDLYTRARWILSLTETILQLNFCCDVFEVFRGKIFGKCRNICDFIDPVDQILVAQKVLQHFKA